MRSCGEYPHFPNGRPLLLCRQRFHGACHDVNTIGDDRSEGDVTALDCRRAGSRYAYCMHAYEVQGTSTSGMNTMFSRITVQKYLDWYCTTSNPSNTYVPVVQVTRYTGTVVQL
jgi:hypothetical protein